MLCPENFTIAVVEAVLNNLAHDLVPEATLITPREHGEPLLRGFGAIVCLTTCVSCQVGRSQASRSEVSRAIVEQLHDILAWVGFTLCVSPILFFESKYGPLLDAISLMFSQLLGIDDQLSQAMLASTKARRILLGIWCTQIKGDAYFDVMVGQGRNVVVHLWSCILETEGGPGALCEEILSSSTSLAVFCHSLISRINQLRSSFRSGKQTLSVIYCHHNLLSTITSQVIKNPSIHRELRKLGFHKTWSKAIMDLKDEFDNTTFVSCALTVFSLVNRPQANSIRGFIDLIDVGLFSVVVNKLASLNWSNVEAQETGMNLVKHFIAPSFFPQCLPPLQRAVLVLPPFILMSLSNHPVISPRWKTFIGGIDLGMHAVRTLDRRICDNSKVGLRFVHPLQLEGANSIFSTPGLKREPQKRRHAQSATPSCIVARLVKRRTGTFDIVENVK